MTKEHILTRVCIDCTAVLTTLPGANEQGPPFLLGHRSHRIINDVPKLKVSKLTACPMR